MNFYEAQGLDKFTVCHCVQLFNIDTPPSFLFTSRCVETPGWEGCRLVLLMSRIKNSSDSGHQFCYFSVGLAVSEVANDFLKLHF